MEEYDQRELVDLAVAAANSFTPSSLHDNIILNNNNNYKGQQRALVNYDDTTAGTEDDMSLLESLPVIYDFESNEEQRRIQTNTSSPYQNIVCYKQPTQPTESSCVLPRTLNSVRLLVLTYWMDKISRHVIVPR